MPKETEEQALLNEIDVKINEMNEIKEIIISDPSDENYQLFDQMQREYVDFRNYWRRIGEAVGVRSNIFIEDMKG